MPSGIMDQRHASTTSGLFKEIHKLSEGQTGFPKQKIMPDQHVTLSTEGVLPHQYGDTATSCYKAEEPLVTPKEVEVQSIINLLPDEDDLFSGINDKLRCGMHSRGSDDEEDFDLFQSGGGMELEVDNCLNLYRENSSYTNGVFNGGRSSNGSVAGKHPYGQHSSRTLFVGNINSNLEDSELKTLFEQYGDIRTLYTACKHRGFVVISYYDIRAAWNVMTSLQNKHLDIHYSIPKDNPSEKNINLGILVIYNLDSSVSNDELCQILGRFGEIKEIGKSVRYHNFIEFYDIRAAEAAYCALNGSSIGGKQIKLELRHPGGERQSLMQQFSPVSTHGNLNDNSVSERIEALTATGYPAPTTTSCISDPSVRDGHSKNEMAVGSLKENALSHGSFSVPNSFRMRMPTIFNQFGFHELRNSLDQVKSSSQRTPSYHIHSLPGKYDGSANVENLAVDVGPRILEGTNNSQQAERHGGIFGSSWTGGYPFHGGDYVPRNSKSFHHLPTNPLVWTNSLPYINGIHARCAPKLPALPRLPSHVMNTGSHSPPAANLPVYMGESSEAIGFPMESFRRNFRSGSSDLASHNFFPDGNSTDIFLNSALGSPQRTWNNLPGVNFVASAPTSLYTPKERMMRNLSSCRGEAESCNADKIKYELDIDRVLREEDTRTTLMIKNIPNKYTSKMLLATIDEEHRGTYDFIYLPIDFKNKCNMGYAFINMSDPLQIIPFHKTFNGKRWEKFNSGKVATLSYARIQGKAALIAHFQNSSLMNEDKRCRPLLFCTDGPNAGDQEPFPLGSNIRSRSSKPRSSCNEENHNQASLSSGTNFLTGSMTDSSFERNY